MNALAQGSLRSRVPGTIVVLLALGVASFGFIAARAVRESLLVAAHARMSTLAQQITQASQAASDAREARFRAAAADPAVGAAILAPTPAVLARARTVLAGLGPDTGVVLATSLREAGGRVVAGPEAATVGAFPTGGTDTSVVSPLFAHGDTVLVEYGAPVIRDGRTIGRISQVRRTTNPPTAAFERLRTFIGPEAQLLMGNVDGSVWSDLTQRIYRPPVAPRMARYERDGRMRIATAARYPGAPYVLAVEFPEDRILEPMRPIVLAFVGIGVVVIVVGGAIAWWISAGITGPVVRLTEAAESIAAGKLDMPVVESHRSDEVGRLSRAFATMRSAVKDAHDGLASQVEARTAELRAAQEELLRKERLAILGQLSSGVGHELRNPLGVMTNAVYFLEMTMPDAPPKAREYLGILRAQIRLSERIVSDLLDFARVKAPHRAPTDLGRLVGDQLERAAVPAGVDVRRDVPAGATAFVDGLQVGQVVLNLVTNACQAMEEGGGGTLTVRAEAANGRVRLSVSDTGPGIAPEHLDKVFEPLFTTKARGIGLGLAVSQTLARANGGTLTVASDPGRGATFTLDLPASEA